MKAPLEFRIHGMDCADEVAILRREIVPLVGSPDRLGFDILHLVVGQVRDRVDRRGADSPPPPPARAMKKVTTMKRFRSESSTSRLIMNDRPRAHVSVRNSGQTANMAAGHTGTVAT
jgi:hypothetical protein